MVSILSTHSSLWLQIFFSYFALTTPCSHKSPYFCLADNGLPLLVPHLWPADLKRVSVSHSLATARICVCAWRLSLCQATLSMHSRLKCWALPHQNKNSILTRVHMYPNSGEIILRHVFGTCSLSFCLNNTSLWVVYSSFYLSPALFLVFMHLPNKLLALGVAWVAQSVKHLPSA